MRPVARNTGMHPFNWKEKKESAFLAVSFLKRGGELFIFAFKPDPSRGRLIGLSGTDIEKATQTCHLPQSGESKRERE